MANNITEQQFVAVTDTVIDKLEGGYYHPDMLKDGRIKDSRYGSSGETMLGIDRKNASATSRNTAAWTQFWGIIDKANAKSTWKWNYKGGTLYPQLRTLAGRMMYPHYLNLSKQYLSPQAQAIVNSDTRLVFHFAYAAWNGSGWFSRFAEPINKAVAAGTTKPDALVEIAIKSRTGSTNSLIKQTGEKIKAFIQTLPSLFGAAVNTVKQNKGTAVLIGVALIVAAGFIVYNSKNAA